MTMQTATGTRAPGDNPTTGETAPNEKATGNVPTTLPTGPSEAPFPNTRPKRSGRRFTLPLIGLLIVAGAAWYVADVYRTDQLYVSTDNAQLTGQPVQVGPTSAGRVASLNTAVGGTVHKGDVLAQVVLPSQIGVAQNGAPKVDFLGASDSRVDVVSPIDGIVISVSSAVGATVAPGQPIMTLIDPTQLWVNANIEETKIGRVHAGEDVEITIDALGVTLPGRVMAITPATGAVFSLLPASNASGNFTKVTQLVPVRIALNLEGHPHCLAHRLRSRFTSSRSVASPGTSGSVISAVLAASIPS